MKVDGCRLVKENSQSRGSFRLLVSSPHVVVSSVYIIPSFIPFYAYQKLFLLLACFLLDERYSYEERTTEAKKAFSLAGTYLLPTGVEHYTKKP